MKILTIDFDQSGHRSTYLRSVTTSFMQLGARVSCFDGNKCYTDSQNENELNRKIDTIRARMLRLRTGRRMVPLLRTYLGYLISTVIRPDLVYYTTISKNDWFCQLGYRVQQINWACTYMTFTDYWNPNIATSAMDTVRRLSSSQTNIGIGCLDPRLAKLVSNDFPNVFYIPDVCDTNLSPLGSNIANRLRQLANGRKIISLVGVMDNRKRIQEVIDTIESDVMNNFYWVIAGPLHLQGVDFQQFCRVGTRENVYIHAIPIESETEFNNIIASSDIVNVRYSDWYHPSNVAVKAAAFKKPIMCFSVGTLGENCKQYHLGVSMPQGTSLAEHINAVNRFPRESIDPDGAFVGSNDFSNLKNVLSRFLH